MKKYIGLFWLIIFHAAFAGDDFPASCQPMVIKQETVMLKVKQPALFLIHNASDSDLWITHPVAEPGASAGWSSRLEAKNWSALVVAQDDFELSCIESKPGHEQQIPCVGEITICQWNAVKNPAKPTGTFWAAEDLEISALMAELGRRGFQLPAFTQ